MILLVYPDCKLTNYQKIADSISAIQPNIYMSLLGEYLKEQDITVQMINCDVEKLTNGAVCEIAKNLKPKLIGIFTIGHNLASSTMTMVGAIDLGNKLKEYNLDSKVFIIGGHPTALPKRTLEETKVDYVICGEGYKEITDLYYQGSKEKIIKTKQVIDVNDLPMVDWSLLDPKKYRAHNWHCLGDLEHRSPYGVIWTSMGCPYPCEFCAVNNLFDGQKLYRKRDINSVIHEIDILVQYHQVKNIKIIDDLFITKNPRIYKFCDLLEKRNYDLNMWCFSRVDTVDKRILERLKQVGMNWIAYGFETSSQKILDSTDKHNKADLYDSVISMTHEAGINICADVIVGLPDDDYESIQDTYKFCVKSEFEWVNVYPAFAYPGTPLYDAAIKNELMVTSTDWKQYSPYGYECLPLKTKYLSSAQVLQARDIFFNDYHSRPEYLDMIESKFGLEAKKHIQNLTQTTLKRRLYD